MENNTASLINIARTAGVWYILTMVPSGYGLAYVPSKIMVEGNADETINNMLANEFLFRTGIISQLIAMPLYVLLAFSLSRLLKQVNGNQTKLLVAFVVVQVPIVFVVETFNITSLMILKGEALQAFQPEQKKALAMLFITMHKYGTVTLQIFWGLWLIPFGQLVYTSGFIPKVFGVCLIIGGVGWVSGTVTFLLLPAYYPFVSQLTIVSGAIGELPIVLWLLIKGVKNQKNMAAV